MAEVVLKNVSKRYGNVEALKDLSFRCNDGEFVVLVGPSGAGKTSTLKMIAGLERITSGSILVDGTEINALEPRQRHVAMVFEDYALYPHMSVYQNMASPLQAASKPKAEIDRRVQEVASILGIEGLLDRKPAHLSGGQQQRVAFGRALVKEARVYLMDEPLSHLDAKLRHELRGELRRIHSRLNASIIYAAHDFREAMALADSVVVLNNGVVQQIAPPEEVYDAPANECVAALIGEPPMNLVSCLLDDSQGRLHFSFESFSIPVPPHARHLSKLLPSSANVRIGFRPTHVEVSRLPAGPGYLKGEVYVLEYLGGVSILTVTIESSRVKVAVAAEFQATIGDPIWIRILDEKIRVFDGRSTQRIA